MVAWLGQSKWNARWVGRRFRLLHGKLPNLVIDHISELGTSSFMLTQQITSSAMRTSPEEREVCRLILLSVIYYSPYRKKVTTEKHYVVLKLKNPLQQSTVPTMQLIRPGKVKATKVIFSLLPAFVPLTAKHHSAQHLCRFKHPSVPTKQAGG